jgi:tRNA C32,U32 (ribose-2'-O)-methylase TrmJ
MGNENAGISEEMRELVDGTFTLPMSGFAESYNLSVATAITLAHLSAASQGDKGPLRPGDLNEHQYNCLFLKGLLSSVAQKRVALAVLRREGIELPQEFDQV